MKELEVKAAVKGPHVSALEDVAIVQIQIEVHEQVGQS